jgi:hypothetical protein
MEYNIIQVHKKINSKGNEYPDTSDPNITFFELSNIKYYESYYAPFNVYIYNKKIKIFINYLLQDLVIVITMIVKLNHIIASYFMI